MEYRNYYDGIDPVIIQQVRYQARKLINVNRLSSHMEVEDIEQELISEALERIKIYNPKKAKLSTFIKRTLDYKSKDLIEKLSAKKRSCPICRYMCTKDHEPADVSYDSILDVCLTIDLNRIANLLPEPLVLLLAHLKVYTVNEASQVMKVPRSTVRYAIRRLRVVLGKHGFHQMK